MNNVLVTIAGFICAVLVAALFVPFLINWNSFKDEMEAFGQKVTGQNVRIIGDVELRILPQPVFHTGGLEITNANGEKLLRTSDFILELDFPSLLRGKIEVTSMQLNDGKIFLAKTDGKALNLFNFGGRIGQPIGLDDISIKKLLLNNMDIEFTNQVTNNQKTISINQAEVTARSLRGPFKINGLLNVAADDTIYQREFTLSTGRYTAEKPLSVKVQIKGEQKRSRFDFLGSLVGLEQQPLLVGKLVVKAEQGEDMVGYGHNFGAKVSDVLEFSSDVSLTYSDLKLENLKFAMGSQVLSTQSERKLSDGFKLNGNLSYNWGHAPRLNGAVNIGIADFDYIKKQVLSDEQLAHEQAVYKDTQQLSDLAQAWFATHMAVAADDGELRLGNMFSGNINVNIEQISFLQNNIIDRVRLIDALLSIEDEKLMIQQFTGHFPGNTKLSYALAKQSLGSGQASVMTGEYEFSALHLQRFSNWLLFQNKKLNNITDFWGVNEQISAAGSVDISDAGLNVNSKAVKTRKYQYELNYGYRNAEHNVEVVFDKVSFDNADLTDFQNYIATFAQTAFLKPTDQDVPLNHHLLPAAMIADLGTINLKLHADQSYYGIRDLGIFDAEIKFDNLETELKQLSVTGDKINIDVKGEIPHIYVAKNIMDEAETKPILEFSIIDADMVYTRQLVHDMLFADNLFLDKIIPAKGALNVKGQLIGVNDEGDYYLEVSGEVGSSELGIGVDIGLNDGVFRQQNIQYQLNNESSLNLAGHYNLEALLGGVEAASADSVVNLIIAQNEVEKNEQDVKLLALLGEQKIELIANINRKEPWSLNGNLLFNIADFGLLARQVNLFDGNFDHVKGRVDFDGTVEVGDGKAHISSENIQLFNTQLSAFEVDLKTNVENVLLVDFKAKAQRLNIADLLSFLSGENVATDSTTANYLDDAAKDILKSAQDLFSATGAGNGAAARGFNLKLLDDSQFNGKFEIDELQLSSSFLLKNAEIELFTKPNEQALFIHYNGEFFNTQLAGEFVLRPTDGQLYMDVSMRAFALDVQEVLRGLGVKNQYIRGLIDVDIDLTGQGYSVDGLLANLAGIIDVDLTSLETQYINADYFNREIAVASTEPEILQIFDHIFDKAKTEKVVSNDVIKIIPEKLSLRLQNGIASIAHELSFQKANSGKQSAMFSGQIDLSNDSARFTLQIPLANQNHLPKIRLDWLNVNGSMAESTNSLDLLEYYRVKLLEKNVKRLEQLQIEIKQKNDAEVARYALEKIEAAAFKVEIKQRVELAVAERMLREMTANKPAVPLPMPYVFVDGTEVIEPSLAAESLVNNSLMSTDVRRLILDEQAKIEAAKLQAEAEAAAALQAIEDAKAAEQAAEAAEQAAKAAEAIEQAAAAEAEARIIEAQKVAVEMLQAQKLADEAAAQAVIAETEKVDEIADLLNSPDLLTVDDVLSDEDIALNDDFILDAENEDLSAIGTLTEQDSLSFEANLAADANQSATDAPIDNSVPIANEVEVISIEPLPVN